jgi:hypothetical protein
MVKMRSPNPAVRKEALMYAYKPKLSMFTRVEFLNEQMNIAAGEFNIMSAFFFECEINPVCDIPEEDRDLLPDNYKERNMYTVLAQIREYTFNIHEPTSIT